MLSGREKPRLPAMLANLLLGFALTLGNAQAADDAGTAAAGAEEVAKEIKADVRPAATGPIEKVSRVYLLAADHAGERIVTVGERGIILYSDDRGGSWKQAQVPVQFTLTAVRFADAKTGWALGHDLVILKTSDGGETWELKNFMPEADVPLLNLFVKNAREVIAVGGRGNLFSTKDGGDTWSRRTLYTEEELDAHLFSIGQASNGKMYIGGEAGNMFRSDDGGENWQQLLTPEISADVRDYQAGELMEQAARDAERLPYLGPYIGSYFGMVFLPQGRIIAYAMLGNAFASDDDGKTWKRLVTGQERSIIDSRVLSDGSILLGGMGGLLLRSTDLGETFADLSQKDKVSIHGMLPLGQGKWFFATNAGVRTVELGFD